MAWNPSPVIADLREFARKWGSQQVIVLTVNQNDGTFTVSSYGQTRELCDSAKTISDQIYAMVSDGRIEIDQ